MDVRRRGTADSNCVPLQQVKPITLGHIKTHQTCRNANIHCGSGEKNKKKFTEGRNK
jgi:hypothetical protein